jgi:tetratricopeptide (TPR) repeat protein
MIGVLIMLIWSIPEPARAATRALAVAASAAVIAALSVLTWRQLGYWRDSEALFSHTMDVIGPNPTMHMAWASGLADTGHPDAAIEHYREALRLKPGWPIALAGVGNALYLQAKYEQSLPYFRRSLQLNPNQPIVWMDLGLALAQQNKNVEAESAFRAALRLRPDFAPAKQNLNEVLQRLGRPAE